MFDYEYEMERHQAVVERERTMRQRVHVRCEYELELEDYETAGQEVRSIMQGQQSKRGLEGAAVEDREG